MESQSKLPGPVNQTSNILPWRPTYLSCVMGFVLHQQLLCANYRALYQNLFLFGTDYTISFPTLEMIDKNYRVPVKWIEINRREVSLLEYCTCVTVCTLLWYMYFYVHMHTWCIHVCIEKRLLFWNDKNSLINIVNSLLNKKFYAKTNNKNNKQTKPI